MSTSHNNNLFYAPEEDWLGNGSSVEIKGQEVIHISKVLRCKEGDVILVANGRGDHCECEITDIGKKSVSAKVLKKSSGSIPEIKKVLAFGAIKKRDRLEFAIEKAVELDAWEICIFDADHSERSRLNEERIRTQIISAFKQSRRFFLPKLVIKKSLDDVFDYYKEHQKHMAYIGEDVSATSPKNLDTENNLLLVGPEGGFSNREVKLTKERGGIFINLGKNRLRAETAVVAFLSQYLY